MNKGLEIPRVYSYIKGEKEEYNIQDDYERLLYLKNEKEIKDSNIDLGIAISKKDYNGLKEAIENGADIQCSLEELVERYSFYL